MDLDRLVVALASGEFADREKASADLEGFGPNAVAGARARLAGAVPEASERLIRFLSRYASSNASPYELRRVRGIAALEAIGTPEAKNLLAELAKGNADDKLAREAKAASERAAKK